MCLVTSYEVNLPNEGAWGVMDPTDLPQNYSGGDPAQSSSYYALGHPTPKATQPSTYSSRKPSIQT